MPTRNTPVPVPDATRVEPWVRLELLVPAPWKRWLEEAAKVRAISVGALVRQCIRDLMIRRHDASNGSSSS
jgi:hypothetical protein